MLTSTRGLLALTILGACVAFVALLLIGRAGAATPETVTGTTAPAVIARVTPESVEFAQVSRLGAIPEMKITPRAPTQPSSPSSPSPGGAPATPSGGGIVIY